MFAVRIHLLTAAPHLMNGGRGRWNGKDGKGRPEGGVTPSNLTWAALTTNYEGKRKSGRTHPAYDERSLKKAITMGIDPAGNKLHPTMPKYKMSMRNAEILVSI